MDIKVLLLSLVVFSSCSSKNINMNISDLKCNINPSLAVFTDDSLYFALDIKKQVFRFKPEKNRFESRGMLNDIKYISLSEDNLMNIYFEETYLMKISDKEFANKLRSYQFGKIDYECKRLLQETDSYNTIFEYE